MKLLMVAVGFTIFEASMTTFIYLVFRNSYFLAVIIVSVKINTIGPALFSAINGQFITLI